MYGEEPDGQRPAVAPSMRSTYASCHSEVNFQALSNVNTPIPLATTLPCVRLTHGKEKGSFMTT